MVNLAAERLFGIEQKSVLTHSLAEVLREHQLIELWQRCQETGESQSISLNMSERHLYLEVIATPLSQALHGNTLMLFQNQTRVRQIEKVRRDFISNISHELRTPLASLKALTETLQEGALDDPPAAHRFLQRMETEVDALSLMVSELLELSRIESGQVPLQFQETTPIDLITKAVERLSLQAERAGLVINIVCPDDLPSIQADPSRLEQVLVNLLHNAIKFTPSGGTITVQASQQNDSQKKNNILFFVRDSGIGIASDDLPRIFERFYKADRARSGSGTGLGLAIARHQVEAHGGKIWAESIEGRGSTFYFTIPLPP
jgi:two-component system phosphate regulon sensor histidine kinase PhoR